MHNPLHFFVNGWTCYCAPSAIVTVKEIGLFHQAAHLFCNHWVKKIVCTVWVNKYYHWFSTNDSLTRIVWCEFEPAKACKDIMGSLGSSIDGSDSNYFCTTSNLFFSLKESFPLMINNCNFLQRWPGKYFSLQVYHNSFALHSSIFACEIHRIIVLFSLRLVFGLGN